LPEKVYVYVIQKVGHAFRKRSKMNGFPFAKYLTVTGDSMCSWTTTPTFASAAKMIPKKFVVQWDQRDSACQTLPAEAEAEWVS
jgi:hypothetical protein